MRNSVIFKTILVGSILVLAINYLFAYHQNFFRFTVLSDAQQHTLSTEKQTYFTSRQEQNGSDGQNVTFSTVHSDGGDINLRQLDAKTNKDDNSYLTDETGNDNSPPSRHKKSPKRLNEKLDGIKEKKSEKKPSSSTQNVLTSGSDDVNAQDGWRHLHTDCPDVLNLMLTGWWTPRRMTSAEKEETRKFYIDVRRYQGLPLSFEREDRKCGNVPFPKPVNKWRAMCNPDGPRPCCYEYICTNATQQQCTCTNCTDMRTLIHAEYATWHAEEARCQPIDLSVADICRVLDGYSLAFVGDSLMRHFYIGFLMFIRGDLELGAMDPGASPALKKRCHGKYMFPSHYNCTKYMQTQAQACEGRVNITYLQYYHPDGDKTPAAMIQQVMDLQRPGRKVFTVVGFGSHYKLNSTRVKKESLVPLLRKLTTTPSIRKAKVLWTEIHAPSVLKSPLYAKQTHVYVKRFNADIRKVLRQYDVPFFDTYNLTSHALMTFDGSHYGLGVNRVKALILLNYILELKSKGLW